jgi:hypothetical protein
MCIFMFNKGAVTKQWQCQLPAFSLWCAHLKPESQVWSSGRRMGVLGAVVGHTSWVGGSLNSFIYLFI